MTRQQLLAALVTVAGISVGVSAGAATTSSESAALDAALANGPVGLQEFLSENPNRPLAKEALGKIIELARTGKAQGFARSGNPNAAGSPDNPGVGNPNTPDC